MATEDWGTVGEGRERIIEWREERLKSQARGWTFSGFRLSIFAFKIKSSILFSFVNSFSYMVVIHMAIAGIAVFLAIKYKLSFDMQVALLVSPIVFPLAFSINTDLKRRDTVLEHIAHFQSSGMVLYMCMRAWRKETGLDGNWIDMVHGKIKSLLFLLREYLFTSEDEQRKFILGAIYEDIGDVNDMVEQIRTSQFAGSGPLLSRVLHLLACICSSFEHLRVLREYRSPRSIRSFNKVLIMLLPVILAPYFSLVGAKQENKWAPYFISIIVAFVFSALQGVQDTLDDPFDGVGEDDIQLNSIYEWVTDSFESLRRRPSVARFNKTAETVESSDINAETVESSDIILETVENTGEEAQKGSQGGENENNLSVPEITNSDDSSDQQPRADYGCRDLIDGAAWNIRKTLSEPGTYNIHQSCNFLKYVVKSNCRPCPFVKGEDHSSEVENTNGDAFPSSTGNFSSVLMLVDTEMHSTEDEVNPSTENAAETSIVIP